MHKLQQGTFPLSTSVMENDRIGHRIVRFRWENGLYFDCGRMEQGVLSLDRIRGPSWCDKCTRSLAILVYADHIQCWVANIGRLACINMWLLMSRGVKFVTGSSLASTPCYLNYNPYLSWDWASVGRWTL